MDVSSPDDRPLAGLRVVVTRPLDQSGDLVTRLRLEGAEPVVIPTIRIEDPVDGGVALRAALTRLGTYSWLVVTSANGARRVLDALPPDARMDTIRVAAIGPATAAELKKGGVDATLLPDSAVGESLVASFPDPVKGDGPILLARAAVARDVVPDGLRSRGWVVDVVDAYRTVPVERESVEPSQWSGAAAVTFTSSSTVRRWVELFGAHSRPPLVVCIGPVTADTARQEGLEVDVVSEVHTAEGMVDALRERVRADRERFGPA